MPPATGAHGSPDPPGTGAPVLQPCRACGEETAVGSVFFADRRTIEDADGAPIFLCILCDGRIRASRRGRRRLTDDEVRILVRTGALLDLAWKRF